MSAQPGREVFVFLGFSLDPRQRLLFGPDGQSVPLSTRAFDTLLYLVEHPNELVDKQALMKAVWPGVIVEENNLSQSISVVRRALGEAPGEHRFIVTAPGRGFRFVAAVELRDTVSASAPLARRSRMSVILIGATLFVLAGYLLARHLASRPVAAVSPRTSVAVMPFVNLTGDASKEYLGDGMAEEIINVLTKVPDLTVPSRTSSFAYKGRNLNLRQIGQELHVGTVLEGSVRATGDRIRITAQLIDAESDRHLWSETFDRQFTDIFTLQDELATAIVNEMRGTVKHGLVPQRPPTYDVQAYQLYLQAESIGSRRTEEAFWHNVDLLNQAIARDPRFARAIAGRAALLLNFPVLGYAMPNSIENAKRDAERAISIDPSLPEALNALATVNVFFGDWVSAEMNFRKALAAAPNDAVIIRDHQTFLLQSVGQLRQAHMQMQEGYRLAPADVGVITMLAHVKSRMGLDADAVRLASLAVEMGRAPEVPPVPEIFADAARRGGRYAEAAQQRINGLSPAVREAGGAEVLKLVYAALGDPSKKARAGRALRGLVEKTRLVGLDSFTRIDFIIYFASLGGIDDAYRFANQSLDEFARSGTVGALWGGLWIPEMDPFRRDPRFQALVTRLKLPDYWKRYGPPDGCNLQAERLICH